MKISIIVPIYNGEKYIEKTINSLLEQSYKEIELILVNDGSKDKSLNICKSYADKDARIVVINKENGGISNARNCGLKRATGEMVSFVDQDDKILPNIYTTLTKNISKYDDMVISGKSMLLLDKNNKVIEQKEYKYLDRTITDKKEIVKLCFNKNRDTCLLHLWNCLYRRSIIEENKIQFDENLKFGHEDSLFNIQYANCCSRIRLTSGIVYQYYRREATSTSMQDNSRYIQDIQRYASVVSGVMDCDSSMLFTYLFRLGINLFSQYSNRHELDKSVLQLKDIYEITNTNSYSSKINFGCINSKFYGLFLASIVFLLKIKLPKLCVRLIYITKKK